MTAIPELLQVLNIKGHIVTIDAMGTQVRRAEQIIKQKGTYVLAVKANQGNLYEEVVDYFNDAELLTKVKEQQGYKKTIEKTIDECQLRE